MIDDFGTTIWGVWVENLLGADGMSGKMSGKMPGKMPGKSSVELLEKLCN